MVQTTQQWSAPKGYKTADVNIAGWWVPRSADGKWTGPIHGRLVGALKFRNTKRRDTLVYLLKLVEPCIASVKQEGSGLTEDALSPGEICAVFHSGGLTRLQSLQGALVWIAPDLDEKGEQKTKQLDQGEMKLWRIVYQGAGTKLTIEERVKQDDQPPQGPIDYPDIDGDIAF